MDFEKSKIINKKSQNKNYDNKEEKEEIEEIKNQIKEAAAELKLYKKFKCNYLYFFFSFPITFIIILFAIIQCHGFDSLISLIIYLIGSFFSEWKSFAISLFYCHSYTNGPFIIEKLNYKYYFDKKKTASIFNSMYITSLVGMGLFCIQTIYNLINTIIKKPEILYLAQTDYFLLIIGVCEIVTSSLDTYIIDLTYKKVYNLKGYYKIAKSNDEVAIKEYNKQLKPDYESLNKIEIPKPKISLKKLAKYAMKLENPETIPDIQTKYIEEFQSGEMQIKKSLLIFSIFGYSLVIILITIEIFIFFYTLSIIQSIMEKKINGDELYINNVYFSTSLIIAIITIVLSFLCKLFYLNRLNPMKLDRKRLCVVHWVRALSFFNTIIGISLGLVIFIISMSINIEQPFKNSLIGNSILYIISSLEILSSHQLIACKMKNLIGFNNDIEIATFITTILVVFFVIMVVSLGVPLKLTLN